MTLFRQGFLIGCDRRIEVWQIVPASEPLKFHVRQIVQAPGPVDIALGRQYHGALCGSIGRFEIGDLASRRNRSDNALAIV